MKFLYNKSFIFTVFIVFILSLVGLYSYGNLFGILLSDARSIVISSTLMLLATFIAISLPLYLEFKTIEQQRDEDLRNSYLSIARYVGEEIADNIVRIEDILTNNKKTTDELGIKFPNISQIDKSHQSVGIWKAIADDLLIGLEDINHQSLIMSGILTKVPDNKMNFAIKDAYSKMSNLKQKLRRISIFFGEILYPPSNIPARVIQDALNSKVPDGIKSTEEDINIYLKYARTAIKEINKIIKPYGKEVKIITTL